MNKHIEIVRCTTKRLSSMSQLSGEAIFTILAKHYTSVRISVVNNLSDLEAIVARNPDLVFWAWSQSRRIRPWVCVTPIKFR